MIDLVKQTIKHYIQLKTPPKKEELNISNTALLEKKASLFVTLYKNGNIIGSSGNIRELESSVANELIVNTLYALNKSKDTLQPGDEEKIKIRIDVITRKMLETPIGQIIPEKMGLMAIKSDYSKLSIILPNISPTITSGEELFQTLFNKLGEPCPANDDKRDDFLKNNYLIYEITSHIVSNY